MELIFEDDLRTMTTRVYIKTKRGDKTVIIGFDGERLIEQELGDPSVSHDDIIKPLFILGHFDKKEFLSGCVNEASRLNIRTENENHLKGKLEATELHLNDMRDMSKKLLDDILKENIAIIQEK